jgi:hypothetical protein
LFLFNVSESCDFVLVSLYRWLGKYTIYAQKTCAIFSDNDAIPLLLHINIHRLLSIAFLWCWSISLWIECLLLVWTHYYEWKLSLGASMYDPLILDYNVEMLSLSLSLSNLWSDQQGTKSISSSLKQNCGDICLENWGQDMKKNINVFVTKVFVDFFCKNWGRWILYFCLHVGDSGRTFPCQIQ